MSIRLLRFFFFFLFFILMLLLSFSSWVQFSHWTFWFCIEIMILSLFPIFTKFTLLYYELIHHLLWRKKSWLLTILNILRIYFYELFMIQGLFSIWGKFVLRAYLTISQAGLACDSIPSTNVNGINYGWPLLGWVELQSDSSTFTW